MLSCERFPMNLHFLTKALFTCDKAASKLVRNGEIRSRFQNFFLHPDVDLFSNMANTGMPNFTESGIEGNNKFLRQHRINYARKTSQLDNITDSINRLWDKSDTVVRKVRDRIACSNCKAKGHTARSCEEMKDALLRPSSYAELLPQRIKFRSSKKSKCEVNLAQIRRLKPTRKTIFNSGTNSASLPHLNINFVLNSGRFQTPF